MGLWLAALDPSWLSWQQEAFVDGNRRLFFTNGINDVNVNNSLSWAGGGQDVDYVLHALIQVPCEAMRCDAIGSWSQKVRAKKNVPGISIFPHLPWHVQLPWHGPSSLACLL